MSIQEELAAELRDAMKQQDKPRRDVVRQIQTEIATARSDPDFAGDLDDAFYQKVISSYVKKMDKARSEYVSLGERGAAMADGLAFEIDYLSRWLPTKLDEASTRVLVRDVIAELGVGGDPRAAGRVTGTLMRARGGDLDGGLVSRIVAEELG